MLSCVSDEVAAFLGDREGQEPMEVVVVTVLLFASLRVVGFLNGSGFSWIFVAAGPVFALVGKFGQPR